MLDPLSRGRREPNQVAAQGEGGPTLLERFPYGRAQRRENVALASAWPGCSGRAVALRGARPRDLQALLRLIEGYAERGLLLWRSEASLRASLADFVVAAAAAPGGETILGCGALARLGPGLGEVRSLAVRADAAGQGVGRTIVARLLGIAWRRGLGEVLALTRRPSFFEALGFQVTRRERFPAKLRADCASCRRNLCCDEIAMVARLG